MTRVLLDENLPRQLKRALPELVVHTVPEMGWAGVKNGELLRLAAAEFDVFLTADRNLPHQQTLDVLNLGVILLVARSTKLEDLRPLAPIILQAVVSVQAGEVLRVPTG